MGRGKERERESDTKRTKNMLPTSMMCVARESEGESNRERRLVMRGGLFTDAHTHMHSREG